MAAAQRFASLLDSAGLHLRAALDAAIWDAAVPPAWRSEALLPGARAAVLVASGGRALWRAFERAAEFGVGPDPLDTYTRRVVEAAADSLCEAGHPSCSLLAFERRGGVWADFVALGRLAGLGAPSRLGLLLHPVYGPWLSLRAAILTELPWQPLARPLEGFDPCNGCPAPCATACPGGAVLPSGFDVARCGATRARLSGCAASCEARRACVVGREHAYTGPALAHHMRAARLP